jgi:putative oxidoreductase
MGRVVGGRVAGIDRERTMTLSDSSRRYAVTAVSLAVAAVFIYAGIDKIRDPLQFADSIAAFAILPAVLINLLAMGLPPFEIASGLLLIGPWTRRMGSLAVAIILVVFMIALSSALLRGLTLDCGCFGPGAPSRPRMWLELALDAVLLSGALFVYLRSISRLVFTSR